MGDFSYANNNPNYDVSFYGQMNKFLTQLCQEAKLDRFDLREERSDHSGGCDCIRDVLLVRDGKALLSVLLAVQPTSEKTRLVWPEKMPQKSHSEFGGRLAEAIEKKSPAAPKPDEGPRIQALHWWVIFRGGDDAETVFEGDQFELAGINRAFNAIESRLIEEITKQ